MYNGFKSFRIRLKSPLIIPHTISFIVNEFLVTFDQKNILDDTAYYANSIAVFTKIRFLENSFQNPCLHFFIVPFLGFFFEKFFFKNTAF